MKDQLVYIKEHIEPKNNFWKILARVGVLILSIVIKNQKNVNPADVDKGATIANEILK